MPEAQTSLLDEAQDNELVSIENESVEAKTDPEPSLQLETEQYAPAAKAKEPLKDDNAPLAITAVIRRSVRARAMCARPAVPQLAARNETPVSGFSSLGAADKSDRSGCSLQTMPKVDQVKG